MAMKRNDLDPQVIEYLLKQTKKPGDIFGEDGLFKQLKKALTERILEGELTTELGYRKHDTESVNENETQFQFN